MQLSVVILAAGQGKRMNSSLPKVLQPLAGLPLLQHVINAARSLNPGNIYVVYGHGGVQVQAALAHEPVEWVLQADQLGEGVGELLGAGAHPIAQPVRGGRDRRHDLLAPAAIGGEPEPDRQ